jgi:hypothetical protein
MALTFSKHLITGNFYQKSHTEERKNTFILNCIANDHANPSQTHKTVITDIAKTAFKEKHERKLYHNI